MSALTGRKFFLLVGSVQHQNGIENHMTFGAINDDGEYFHAGIGMHDDTILYRPDDLIAVSGDITLLDGDYDDEESAARPFSVENITILTDIDAHTELNQYNRQPLTRNDVVALSVDTHIKTGARPS